MTKKRKKEISIWPPPVSKLPTLHDSVVIFVLVLSLDENSPEAHNNLFQGFIKVVTECGTKASPNQENFVWKMD